MPENITAYNLEQAGISDDQLLEDYQSVARYCWSNNLSLFASEVFMNHLTIAMPDYHKTIYNELQFIGGAISRDAGTPPSSLQGSNRPAPKSPRFSKSPITINNNKVDNSSTSSVPSSPDKSELILPAHKNIVVVEPREFGKSTKAMIYVMWSLLNRYKKFVLYISKSFDHAVKLIGPIKREFETNEEIQEVYGDVRKEKWTESEMEFANGSKLLALGRGQSVRGLKFLNWRPDLVILDDIEDDESINNKELRLKLQEWLDKQVLPGVDSKKGTIAAFGTILHPDSLLSNLSTENNRLDKYQNFKSLFFGALDKDEQSIWEEKFSTESLIAERQRDSYTFAQERMNQPIPIGSGMFKKEYFQYYTLDGNILTAGGKETRFSECNLYLTCDIAMTEKEHSDYTVIMITAVSPSNEYFVIEYTRARWEDPDKIINEIFRLNSKYPEIKVNGIEAVAAQKWLLVQMRKDMRKRNAFLHLAELKADRDKLRRISSLQPLFSNGAVYLTNNMSELEAELLLFPKSPFDDVSDALAYVLQIARPGDKVEDPNKSRIRPPYKFSMDGQLVIDKLMNRSKPKGILGEYKTKDDFDPYEEDSFEEALIKKWNEEE